MTQYSPPPLMTPGTPRSHRGVLVLIFGILGIVLSLGGCGCGLLAIPGLVFSVLAWVFGVGDLRLIDANQMDPTGRSMTNAGKILGIIGVVVSILMILLFVAAIVFSISMPGGFQGMGKSTP